MSSWPNLNFVASAFHSKFCKLQEKSLGHDVQAQVRQWGNSPNNKQYLLKDQFSSLSMLLHICHVINSLFSSKKDQDLIHLAILNVINYGVVLSRFTTKFPEWTLGRIYDDYYIRGFSFNLGTEKVKTRARRIQLFASETARTTCSSSYRKPKLHSYFSAWLF